MNKFLMMTATLLTMQSAHASWYQGYCSNADGSVKTASGHNDNFTVVTVRTYKNDGTIVEKKIRDTEGALIEEVQQTSTISSESQQRCVKPNESGWASSSDMSSRQSARC